MSKKTITERVPLSNGKPTKSRPAVLPKTQIHFADDKTVSKPDDEYLGTSLNYRSAA
jgi:hypothetical protein